MKTVSKALLASLLFSVLILKAGSIESGEKDKTVDVEQLIYDRLKRDGGLADPGFPFIVYVKKIDGAKLLAVEFMRHDASGKKFDLIGRAETIELRVDLKQKQLLVDARDVELKMSDGTQIWLESKIWVFVLPADLSFLKVKSAKLPKKADLPLSVEDRKFLAEGFPKDTEPSVVDRKLKQAFGPDCKELQRPLRWYLPSFDLVVAAGSFVKAEDGRTRYTDCSIAQFRKDGISEVVQLTIRNREVTSNLHWTQKTEGKTICFECPDGTRIIVNEK